MKYIVFASFPPEDFDKIRAKGQELQKERKKHPERFGGPQSFPGHVLASGLPTLPEGNITNFWIQEYDERLLIDSIAHYQHFVSGASKGAIFKYVPIVEVAKVREAYKFTKEATA